MEATVAGLVQRLAATSPQVGEVTGGLLGSTKKEHVSPVRRGPLSPGMFELSYSILGMNLIVLW